METNYKSIYLGGGCFWCTEAVFASLRGVERVTPGYMGGIEPNPSYELVTSGTTGYVEVVEILYHEEIIQLKDILEIFFATHDPTTLNRQGNDVGTQYRSIIFYTDEQQAAIVQEALMEAQKHLPPGKDIVTEVKQVMPFYRAEDYHQKYYAQHSGQAYCQLVIHPKLEKLQKEFAEKLT